MALKGDAGRGNALFWSQAVNCARCHKIGDKGTALGPDLTSIGKSRPREDLLESILEPLRRIEPKYAAYVVRTVDGRTFSGLLVKRDEKGGGASRRPKQGNRSRRRRRGGAEAVADVADARAQLAGLTAQEAADLLEYLVTRK